MNNRTKKEQKLIDQVNGFLIIASGIAGWYITESFTGAGIAIALAAAGIILFSLWRAAQYKQRMKEAGMDEIDQMTGRQFEEYIGTLFSSFGYDVTYTPVTGDYGADLILKKGAEIIAVQAKRYKSKVGVKAVQEVIPAVKFYDANMALVVTHSTFTKQAVELAEKNEVRMVGREELVRLSRQMKQAA